MKHRIITISREFGSGGRTIGKKVAEALGISCYDNELIQKIAAESGFNENYILDTGEDAPGGFLASAFSHLMSFTVPSRLRFRRPCMLRSYAGGSRRGAPSKGTGQPSAGQFSPLGWPYPPRSAGG